MENSSFEKCEVKEFIGKSKIIREVRAFMEKVCSSDHPVLLLGETGVGKDLVANHIHFLSSRREKLFLALNCANFPEYLIESELFGHRKGAFTDAREDKIGLIEMANGGTLFFDEISELSLLLQAKLLRVIEHKEIRRIGETRARKIDVRFIFATNKDLKKEVRLKRFREDLYFRINVFHLHIPPLRERKEDLPYLVEHILKIENRRNRKKKTITKEALEKLMNYHFPGNIRELENMLQRAHSFSEGDKIRAEDIKFEEKGEEELSISERIFREMVKGGRNFFEVVHKPFLKRDLNRREVREIIALGLKETNGSYKKLLPLFNIGEGERDYKRFMNILRIYKLK